MGLDTTHDCWHGSYTSFMLWRTELAEAAGWGNIRRYEGYGGRAPWPKDVLSELLRHSDCDGELAAAICAPLANRLEGLLPLLGAHAAERTQRFIAGLREAASCNEAVEFH